MPSTTEGFPDPDDERETMTGAFAAPTSVERADDPADEAVGRLPALAAFGLPVVAAAGRLPSAGWVARGRVFSTAVSAG
ncbi:hypothetical protein ACIRSU_00375 [Streptomyces sp. NPDC101160]|uniref:hypothetical protein n=1 Tax=Streptomyces sp. NPDC101160 TaxID=3366118 RepID=UPI003812DE26